MENLNKRSEALEEGFTSPHLFDTAAQIFSILRRRWLLVAVTTVLTVALTVLLISMLQPIWRASTTLVLNPGGQQVLDEVKGVNNENHDSTQYKLFLETQKQILSSRRVAEAALSGLGLAHDPVFLGIDPDLSEAQREEKQIDPVERLRELVSVSEVRNSRILEISAEYPEPEIARQIADSVAQSYVNFVSVARQDTGVEAKKSLSEERKKAKTALELADNNLDLFKADHRITTIALEDRQSIVTQNIITLSARAKESQASRIEIESTYREAKALHEQGSIAGASLLPASDRISLEALRKEHFEAERNFNQLDLRYGEKHPSRQQAQRRLALASERLQEASRDVLDSMKARVYAARQTESKLQSVLDKEREKALQLGRLEPQYPRPRARASQR